MSLTIRLSIVIPHFNNGRQLGKLLSSIIEECTEYTQILVIDDNSTEFIDEYITCKNKFKNRVEFYSNHTGTRSAGVCRNIGIDHAIGKWLMFCDADDYLLPGWFRVVEKYFANNEDVIFFRPIAVKIPSGNPSKRGDSYRKFLEDYSLYKRGSDIRLRTRFIVPWSKIVKADLINKHNIRYDNTLYSNDVMFGTKLGLKMKSFVVSNEEIYCVTECDNSLTKQATRESFRIRAEVAARRVEYVKKNLSYKEWLQTGLGSISATYVLAAIKRGYGWYFARNIFMLFRDCGIRIISFDLFLSPMSILSVVQNWP